jgi:hypothetical protein
MRRNRRSCAFAYPRRAGKGPGVARPKPQTGQTRRAAALAAPGGGAGPLLVESSTQTSLFPRARAWFPRGAFVPRSSRHRPSLDERCRSPPVCGCRIAGWTYLILFILFCLALWRAKRSAGCHPAKRSSPAGSAPSFHSDHSLSTNCLNSNCRTLSVESIVLRSNPVLVAIATVHASPHRCRRIPRRGPQSTRCSSMPPVMVAGSTRHRSATGDAVGP